MGRSTRILLVAAVTAAIVAGTYFLLSKDHSTQSAITMPQPTEGEGNHKLREAYEKLRHRAAPGVEWEAVEAENARIANLMRSQTLTTGRTTEVFANGAIIGEWEERGAANQAGSIRAVDYVPATNIIYTVSNGGTIWKSVLGSGSWTVVSQAMRFSGKIMRAFTKSGGSGIRLLVASGPRLYYSDNEGSSFIPSVGINLPVEWEGNYIAQVIRLNDASKSIYCLVRLWSNNPVPLRFWLYRSIDEGTSFTKIHEFTAGEDDRVSLCNPYNTNDLYAADILSQPGSLRMYRINANTVTLLNTFPLGLGNVPCLLKGTRVGGTTTLYLMTDNTAIYRSTNAGGNWTLQSMLPERAWMKMNVSINDANAVSFGGVHAFRSSDGGAGFTRLNDWREYYGNIVVKLHADIMEIEYFKKTDNTEFAIINTHGGTYISYDNLATVANQSVTSHYATEYYDVLTDTINRNRIFVGTQDQGMQRTMNGTAPGIQDFLQVAIGDYGQLALTSNNQFLWAQYPGGMYYMFNDLGDAISPSFTGAWTMDGTYKPNAGWMLAGASTADAGANEIWMGGGNIHGGDGSYLVKIAVPTTFPYTVTTTQLSYDFRPNTNTLSAGISAIEQSLVDPNKLYVGTEDGTFFYSNDLGATWNKTSSFGGPTPWWLYGSCVLASRKNANLVWYAGSGYSNPAVYVSTNGGASFTPMSEGLPPTLVNEIVATPNEDFLFAATEAGPYVYVVAEDEWFPLISSAMPIQYYSSVEYIAADRVVRFGTMGRGIWDFKITSVVLPVDLVRFEAAYRSGKGLLNWSTASESNSSQFVVERSLDSRQFTAIDSVQAAGNSNEMRHYHYADDLHFLNTKTFVYYRLLQKDGDGKSKYSTVVKLQTEGQDTKLALLFNPVQTEAVLRYTSNREERVMLRIYDMKGSLVKSQAANAVTGLNQFWLNTASLGNGLYIIQLQSGRERSTIQMLKR